MNGLRIALTGAPGTMTRNAFRDRVAALGGEYVARLDAETDLLVVGSEPLESKVQQARSLGVEVQDWAEFEGRFESTSLADAPLADELVDGPPSLAFDAGEVRVLDLMLGRRTPGPLTPSLDAFADYTLDAPTLTLLRGLARAVALSHPCLIEGDTATSKTSAIRFLAALVGAEVVRLNLNGQTDAGELVGRYVPAEDGGWRFAEGLVPQAMRRGWWVVLDEVNLAEPAVLERLNPVLERVPELVLTEGPGTRFGPGGEVEVHPDFRVFATMNPAEYAGRAVLSEAWRDRFVAHVVARPAGELELRQMLEHAVNGRQPAVEVDGVRWAPSALTSAGRPRLAAVAALRPRWARVAALFAGLIEMSSPSAGKAAPLGVGRRERYVFSRRGVLGVIDALDGLALLDPHTGARVGVEQAPEALLAEAIRGATVERMRDAADRDRVATLARSLGLLP